MRFRRFALLVTLVTSMGANSAGATTAAPLWHVARIVTLPNGGTAVAQGFLPALSCPSAGNCSAGGAYTDGAGHTQGLLLNEVAGVWRTPVELRSPSNAGTDPSASVSGISCYSAGNCSAVGTYSDASSNSESFIANEVRGVWSSAREVNLPSNALVIGQDGAVRSVACSSTGNCSAVGTYLQQISALGHRTGFALDEVNGVWTNAANITVPSGGNSNPFMTLNQVACSAAGNCGAIGSYIDANNVTRGLVVSEVKGVWKPASAVVLPGNASAYASASLSEISCAAAGNCTALGTYTTHTGAIEGLAEVELQGTWKRAVEIVMPSGGAVNPKAFLYGFSSIDCPSIGNCSGGGQYLDRSGLYQGFLVNQSNGRWRTATTLSLPSGAKAAGKNGGVVAVSCHTAGHCSAGAAFLDQAGNYQAIVVNEINGTWTPGEKLSLPTGATSVGVNGGVYGLICNLTTSCTATGTYLSAQGLYQGFTVATG